MANFLDIVPALGRGLDFAQGFPGGYDAIDLRRAMSVGRQEGAVTANAYKVSQRGAGANMSVDVATEQGQFLVQGDSVTGQGLYLVPALATVTNLDVGASNPTNPRIDQVVLEARDDAHTLDGITRARVYVLPGTATAAATLDNRNGAAALPASTARLADILVPTSSTSVTTANIRDRRQWAEGAHYVLSGQSGNLGAQIGNIRIETAVGNTVRVRGHLNVTPSAAGVINVFALRNGGYMHPNGAPRYFPTTNIDTIDFAYEDAAHANPSNIYALLTSGSGTYVNAQLIVQEILSAGNRSNG